MGNVHAKKKLFAKTSPPRLAVNGCGILNQAPPRVALKGSPPILWCVTAHLVLQVVFGLELSGGRQRGASQLPTGVKFCETLGGRGQWTMPE